MRYFLIINFIAIYSFSMAQNNYVLLFKGDSIAGEIKILSYDQMDRVQINNVGKKTVFPATQVKSLHLNGAFYQAVRYENNIRFMKVLKSGYLSLLAYDMQIQGTAQSGQYLLKKDGRGIDVPNLGFKKNVSNFLSDCPEIKSRFEKGDFSKNNIDRIVDLYNLCLEAKSKNAVTETKPKETDIQKMLLLKEFHDKIEAEAFTGKKDALDLLKDIKAKVEKGEPIPNYLAEGLVSYIKEKPDLEKKAKELLNLLKK